MNAAHATNVHTAGEPGCLGLPEEEFWEKYNRRLEFPLSTVAAVLFHILVAAMLVVFFLVFMRLETDKSAVPVKLVNVDGGDDAGQGSPGSGGDLNTLADAAPTHSLKGDEQFPPLDSLPNVLPSPGTPLPNDLGGTHPIPALPSDRYKQLDKDLQERKSGGKKGAGPEAGQGPDGTPGSGPGGVGPDSTRARSLRWVLRFRTATGDDYVAQLAAMGAVILVPLPPDNKQYLYFGDLKNPRSHRPATDDDLKRLGNQIKFSDTRPDSVRGVCEAIGAPSGVKSFWAFFPKGFEDDLSRKETGYRNRRAEDIDETVFRVVTRGGSYDIVVDDQTVKK